MQFPTDKDQNQRQKPPQGDWFVKLTIMLFSLVAWYFICKYVYSSCTLNQFYG